MRSVRMIEHETIAHCGSFEVGSRQPVLRVFRAAKGADCKPAGLVLRWFESILADHSGGSLIRARRIGRSCRSCPAKFRDFGDSWQLSSFLNVLPGMGHPERVRPWTGPERLFIGITIVGVMFLCAAFAMWVVGG